MSGTPQYPPITIGPITYSMGHLDARMFSCPIPSGKFVLGIRARFSNHCFTEEYDPDKHVDQEPIPDGIRKRALCPIRHALSFNLPDIIDSLPNAQIQQTYEKRNYVHYVAVATATNGPYAVFFSIKKSDPGRRQHLELFVESAYVDDEVVLKAAKRPNAIRFSVLAFKVHMGQPVVFAAR